MLPQLQLVHWHCTKLTGKRDREKMTEIRTCQSCDSEHFEKSAKC